MATIAVMGTFDTKGQEHAFIAEAIRERGHETLMIDVGTGAPPTIEAQITREAVAAAIDIVLEALIARN
ncbi:MAG: Tm-1-like ATP-binding domain-containing protein, partial [Flavobacteriales bacterium]|nr:Tm-1-like ATP-binding domain-containing protein [Flavobacteriales bacterium]